MSVQEDLQSAVMSVAGAWKKAKRRADREDRVSRADRERMCRKPDKGVFDPGGRVQGHGGGVQQGEQQWPIPRQRPPDHVCGATDGAGTDRRGYLEEFQYFTQTLLKDFIEDETNEAGNWRVVWDARGHFAEPHTGRRIDIGGIEVEKYITAWNHFRIHETPEFESPSRHQDRGTALSVRRRAVHREGGFRADPGSGRASQSVST